MQTIPMTSCVHGRAKTDLLGSSAAVELIEIPPSGEASKPLAGRGPGRIIICITYVVYQGKSIGSLIALPNQPRSVFAALPTGTDRGRATSLFSGWCVVYHEP